MKGCKEGLIKILWNFNLRDRLLLAGEIRENFMEKGLFAIGLEEEIGFRKIRKGHSSQKE